MNQIRAPNVCFYAHLIRKPFHTFRDALQNGSTKTETSQPFCLYALSLGKTASQFGRKCIWLICGSLVAII
ncbi:hypothetical protein F7Q93_03385 [Brucella pituitosa]|uniref:Uncharacterized protein n=1 Tax=Brucella pituitosa TaxID=571256 RepID=A0A643F5V5_9HYPH|nr:hypothetical protein F7Q93_03385 [Brucella pituitosa]